MTPEQIAAQNAAAAAAKEAEDTAKKAEEEAAKSTDPVKAELERVQKAKGEKTELEKALFTRDHINKRIKELGGEPAAVGASPQDDDEKPVTVGMLRELEAQKATKTALQLADEITDTNERELTKHYLQTRVIPSGNPQQDLRDARALVNSVKNAQVLEEISRKNQGGTGSPAGAPATGSQVQFVPTPEEAALMKSFKLTEKDIIEARKKIAALT